MASFDGDADRLIYFWKYSDDWPRVIDGDKQFALLTLYIS
jgi:phosphomannomutase